MKMIPVLLFVLSLSIVSLQGQTTEEIEQITQEAIDLKDLQPYYHEKEIESRVPLFIMNDSTAYENESEYSIDSENGLLTIHIINKERGIDTVTKSSIKNLTETELKLISERNQLLKFKRKE